MSWSPTQTPKMQGELPHSSMLASRVVNGNNSAGFDRESFEQLLEESLGVDEYDQPNLGTDVLVNYKLICIIFKAGIRPSLRVQDEDPFNARDAGDKDNNQFKRCLDVLHLSILRSPDVLFTESSPEDQVSNDVKIPLYVWLLPSLIPLLRPKQDDSIRQGVFNIFSASMKSMGSTSKSNDQSYIVCFLRQCASGIYCS